MFYKTTNLAILILSIGLFYTASGQTPANPVTEPDFDKYQREWFSVGIAASYAYFNSSATYYDKTKNQTTYISPEGQLGLDRSQFIPAIYGFLHPAKRHWVCMAYI